MVEEEVVVNLMLSHYTQQLLISYTKKIMVKKIVISRSIKFTFRLN